MLHQKCVFLIICSSQYLLFVGIQSLALIDLCRHIPSGLCCIFIDEIPVEKLWMAVKFTAGNVCISLSTVSLCSIKSWNHSVFLLWMFCTLWAFWGGRLSVVKAQLYKPPFIYTWWLMGSLEGIINTPVFTEEGCKC